MPNQSGMHPRCATRCGVAPFRVARRGQYVVVGIVAGRRGRGAAWARGGKVIALETMVQAFAHTSKPDAAQAFYLQAYAMTRLLGSLWRDRSKSSEQDLVSRLLSGRSRPESLFEDALRERAPQLREAPLKFLEAYIRDGYRCAICQ